MADKKISELTNITGANLADADEFVVVDTSANETKAITYAELKSGLDTSTGFVRVTGDTMTGNLSFGDNNKAIFGAGSDLQIYHDGSNSYVSDNGTGNLTLSTDGVEVNVRVGGEYMAKFKANGPSELLYDNSPRLATTSTGVDVTGTVTADGLTVDGNITSTGGDLNLATLDLNAIAASKAVTAVDVFVYDTSKDSDGGAWRKRTQHTSWYNETLNTATRGSRREFPAVAVIVAEATKVTIYDGDDPALPMWMVFTVTTTYSGGILTTGNSGSVTSLAAVNGYLVVSTGKSTGNDGVNGVFVIAFPSDSAIKYCASQLSTTFDLDISKRNAANGSGNDYITGISLPRLVNNFHNDVAMTVLPDAPIDPATGLPVPTIAVATDGGVSVIRDDGTVVDITYGTYTIASKVDFRDDNSLTFPVGNSAGSQGWVHVFHDIPTSDIADPNGYVKGSSDEHYAALYNAAYNLDLQWPGKYSKNALDVITPLAWGSAENLIKLAPNKSNPSKGMLSAITSTYNTGWMNGDIKGAFLSSTDTASLVGSGELVTNGTFDSNITGWTDNSAGSSSISWNASGYLQMDVVGTDRAHADTTITTVIGQRYRIDITDGGGDPWLFYVGTSTGSGSLVNVNTITHNEFVATSTTTYLRFSSPAVDSSQVLIDNISVKLADADRSVNNKGLIVNGTVTRSPVATGAELVAYSGFSASNYLEQPYNSALDFGTGDFCVMGWVKGKKSAYNCFVNRTSDKSVASGLRIMDSGSDTVLVTGYGGNLAGGAYPTTSWFQVCFVRKSGVGYIYINGVLAASGAWAVSVTDANATTTFGGYWVSNSLGAASPDIALWRISATAPTAEQIKKIYEDEKVLFQENAAATLYGTSDAVTALAHDEDTGLLHVGTSAGRSVFQGLRRVSNTTTAVGTAISAANGLVAEE